MIIVSLFILLICAPPITTLLISRSYISYSENRELVSMPKFVLSSETLKDYPSQFEKYYNDQFGFRATLQGYLGIIKVKLLHKSTVPTVILGKQDWLYYNGDYSFDDFRGLTPYNTQQLELWKNTLENRQLWLAGQGIKYLFVVAPNKQSIYPEYVPDYLYKINKRTRFEQLLEYLNNHSSIKLMDLRKPLQEAKNNALIYYKTDTHWTDKGAFIAYANIMNQLSVRFPELSIIDQSSLIVHQADKERDLSIMLGLSNQQKERNYFISLKTPCATVLNQDIFPQAPKGSILVKGCNKSKLRAVVFSDSFFPPIEPFLSEHFESVFYVWNRYKHDILEILIDEIHPDIVIEEKVERYLYDVPSPVTPFRTGIELAKKGNPDVAIEFFLEALRIYPHFIPALNELGLALAKRGDLKNAILQFQKVLQISPYNNMAMYNLEKVQADQQKLYDNIDRVILQLQEKLKTNANDSFLYFKLGEAYQNRGYIDKAIIEYKIALKLRPDSTDSINALARAYSQINDTNNALLWFDKMLKINPDDANVYYNIACIYSKQHDVITSISWLKKSLGKNFNNWALIQTDEDLKDIRFSAEYKRLIRNHYN